MGMIITCDEYDCGNADVNYNDTIYYVVDHRLKEELGFTYECNICQECVDKHNADNGNMIIVDPEDDNYVILKS